MQAFCVLALVTLSGRAVWLPEQLQITSWQLIFMAPFMALQYLQLIFSGFICNACIQAGGCLYLKGRKSVNLLPLLDIFLTRKDYHVGSSFLLWITSHNHCQETLGINWLCCQRRTIFFRRKCDEESVGQTGWQALFHIWMRYCFPHISRQDTNSYQITVVWSCNVALGFYLTSEGSVWCCQTLITIGPTHPCPASLP